MMGAARPFLWRTPHLRFWKLLGSGSGEGFTPRPNLSVYGILCVWPDPQTAHDFINTSSLMGRYHRIATETFTLYLHPTSVKGSWSGSAPFCAQVSPDHGNVVALTRATVRLRHLRAFWRQEPDISQRIGANPDVLFKIGLGEVPFLHQMTFSIWPNSAAMDHFARHSGPHAQAIKRVRTGRWFKEELYARFQISHTQGTWGGMNPLIPQEVT